MNEDDKCTKTSGTQCTVKTDCNCGGDATSPDVAKPGDTCNNVYTLTRNCKNADCDQDSDNTKNCEVSNSSLCICGKDTIGSGTVCVGYEGEDALRQCVDGVVGDNNGCNCGDEPKKAEKGDYCHVNGSGEGEIAIHTVKCDIDVPLVQDGRCHCDNGSICSRKGQTCGSRSCGCPDGSYQKHEGGVFTECAPCDRKCSTCSNKADNCTKCADKHFEDPEGECIPCSDANCV